MNYKVMIYDKFKTTDENIDLWITSKYPEYVSNSEF